MNAQQFDTSGESASYSDITSSTARICQLAASLHTNGVAHLPSADGLRETILKLGSNATELAAASEAEPTHALRWVIDNYTLVSHAVPEYRRFKLPAADGIPRVTILAENIVDCFDALFTYRGLLGSVQEFMRITPLDTEELWALRDGLKLEICHCFLNTAQRALRAQQLRLQADKWAERLNSADAPQSMISSAPREPSFRERLLQLMRQHGNAGAVRVLESESAEQIEQEHASQAHDALLLGNAMASLRLLDSIDWRCAVEALSDVEQWLRCDPSGIYPLMDEDSRDMCRRQVCKLAKQKDVSQGAVAKLCVMLARGAGELDEIGELEEPFYNLDADDPDVATNDGAEARQSLECVNVSGDNLRVHVGWWLLTVEGRNALRRAIAPESTIARMRYWLKYHVRGIYISCVALVALIIAAIGVIANVHWGFLVLSIPVYMVCASLIVNRVVNKSCPPNRLPKLHLESVPDSMRTLVVIPALLSNAERARELVNQLAAMGSIDDSPNIDFMLLGDYSDSERAEEVADADISTAAAELAQKYNDLSGRMRLFYLQRARSWSDKQKRFSGHERKRGALMALNQLLLTGEGELAGLAPMPLNDRYKYVITLDADTIVPPGSLRAMIGTLAHPLNRRRIELGRSAGYSVLQPRMELAARSVTTKFIKLFGGEGGVDTYVSAVSEVYQDLSGEGAYTGKGIYDLRSFDEALRGMLPDDAILSHDMLEGCLAGAGLMEDVVLYDGYPGTFKSYAKRQHRWTRGDWQLIPYLMPHIRVQDGRKIPNPLDMLSRWKIAANLWRSLAVPCALILAIAGLWLGNAYIFILGISPIWLPTVLNLFNGITGRALLTRIVQTSFWPREAITELDAISRTLFRVLISRRHMLEWVTSADAERQAAQFDMSACLAAAVLALPGLFVPGYQFIALALALIWAVAPLAARELDKPVEETTELDAEQRQYLAELARDDWRFFETCMAEDAGLPPDNVQLDPPLGAAARTSPTNIGMYMISALSAYELGFIDGDELVLRLQYTANKLSRLEKWRGQMYNWYDINTLLPLRPLYVSAVDNGNLAGCLICCINALSEMAGKLDVSANISQLITALRALLDEMDFSLLYDKRCNLFHIGYNAEQGRLSDSHYDLMGSEARLLTFSALIKGDVPIKHWWSLGRAVTKAGDGAALVSWSGTMFEYLMPQLLIPSPNTTLLGDTMRNVVLEQIYSAAGKPWGVSESGYYMFDAQLNYQYRAFGLPSLALGHTQCQVVAPYAAEMATMIMPDEAISNLKELQRLGFRGACGFYEAIDYSCTHLGAECRVVKSYMAHHQGMALTAICNALTGNRLIKYYMNSPRANALSILLEEKRARLLKATAAPEDKKAPDNKLPQPNDSQYARTARKGSCPPDAHLLHGADCSCFVTVRGDGYLCRNDIMLNRWRGDCIRPEHGIYAFLNVDGEVINICSGERYSGVPLRKLKPCEVKCRFEPGYAHWDAHCGELSYRMEICVSPESGALYQNIQVENMGDKPIIVAGTSCFEVSLSRLADDEAHPAFRNLFVQSEYIADGALLFTRRKRDEADTEHKCTHIVSFTGEGNVSFETSRLRAWGRDADRRLPDGLFAGLSNATGNIVDPCSMLRCNLTIEPHSMRKILFAEQFVSDADAAVSAVAHCKSGCAFERAKELAVTRAIAMVKFLGISASSYKAYQRAAACAVFDNAPRGDIAAKFTHISGNIANAAFNGANTPPNSRVLWQLGISGDLPIVLVNIASRNELALAHEAMQMHELWHAQGLICDLAVVYASDAGYGQPVRDSLRAEANMHSDLVGKPGGLYLLCASQLTGMQREVLYCAACLALNGTGGNVSAQLPHITQSARMLSPYPEYVHKAYMPRNEAHNRLCYNGWGGFGQSRGIPGYIIDYDSDNPTPAPWVNVLANSEFGAVITESGGGHVWKHNSRQLQLTPWTGDPLHSDYGFSMYLRDEHTGEYASVLPGLNRHSEGVYVIHMPGNTRILSEFNNMDIRTDIFTDSAWPMLCVHTHLKNTSPEPQRLSVCGYVDWRLGSDKSDWRFIRTAQSGNIALAISNQAGDVAGEGRSDVTHIACTALINVRDVVASFDKLDFLGIDGDIAQPRGLDMDAMQRRAAKHSGLPASILRASIEIPPHSAYDLSMVIGCAESLPPIQQYITAYIEQGALHRLELTELLWRERLGKFTLETPDSMLNIMANTFLPLQVQASRVWGRTGYYQLGGAFGFRDQLQDMTALIPTEPAEVRAHILECAAHQFEDGDVQHWWHRPYSGVRTHISDDMLFLPYITAMYIEQTGDYAILRAKAPFLKNVPIPESQEDWYGSAEPTADSAPLHEHNLRAIRRACRFGAHGLPLMGCGDWNDGMNRVGEQGAGESVWLGMFLCEVLRVYKPHCDDATWMEETRVALLDSIETNGWDGEWYRRAYFDDGTPLGSADGDECRIDLLSQAWAKLAGLNHADQALDSAWELLVDKKYGIVRLLTPPFADGKLQPGYIKGYLPGIRENGGQYTHSAAWLLMALAQSGQAERAWEALRMLLPANHSQSREQALRYVVEPYVIAADVYGAEPNTGRGGWTWYTGSAAWLLYAVRHSLLGISIKNHRLRFEPLLPDDWDEVSATYHYGASTYQLKATRSVSKIKLDNFELDDDDLMLLDDGRIHQALFPIPRRSK